MKPDADVSTCRQPPKVVRPVIDTHKCEGAGDCQTVCPYDVFTVRKLEPAERKALPFLPWLKVMAHGGKQAFAINAEACHSCGLCVTACPENAIRLTRDTPAETRP